MEINHALKTAIDKREELTNLALCTITLPHTRALQYRSYHAIKDYDPLEAGQRQQLIEFKTATDLLIYDAQFKTAYLHPSYHITHSWQDYIAELKSQVAHINNRMNFQA
jgi:hypothetical protein